MQLYPRWKVSLLLRLEEYGANGELMRYARSKTPINDTKSGDNPPLKAIQDQDASARGVRRWLITKENTAATTPNTQGPAATQNAPAVPVPKTSPLPVMNPSDPKYTQANAAQNPSIRDLNKLYTSQQIDTSTYMQGLSDHYNKGEVFEP